jgi:hypothetical protein
MHRDIQIKNIIPHCCQQRRSFFRSATTPIVFLRRGPQRGKIIGVVGNNMETYMIRI